MKIIFNGYETEIPDPPFEEWAEAECVYSVKSSKTMEDFVAHLYEVNEQIVSMAEKKGEEYGVETDALATIKRVAAAWQETPSVVALKLALKHYMSLLHDGDTLTHEQRREKLNDIHVYIELSEFARGVR